MKAPLTAFRVLVALIAWDGLWGHEVIPNALSLQAGGAPGTFRLQNSAVENNCTTSAVIRIVVAAGNNPVSVSPGTTSYTTPPTGSVTFTVTPLRAGDATIFVDWRISAGANATCQGSGSPSVTVRVTGPATPAPLTFATQPTPPLSLRSEGIAELVGDTLINVTGGTPTPAGQPVPQYNIQLTLDTNVTSRLYPSGLTEALLTIDDPRPGNQAYCAQLAGCPIRGTGSGISYANPETLDNGGQPVRNVYQGRHLDPNNIVWLGVPIDPPGTTSVRVIRITNVRLNAAQAGANPLTSNIRVFQNSTGATVSLVNSQQTLSFVQTGLIFGVGRDGNTRGNFPVCDAPANLPANQTVNIGGTLAGRAGVLRFREGYDNAFKKRNTGSPDPVPQDVFGTNYQTESGLYMPLVVPGAGLAEHGTRLMVRLSNIPNGVQIYVGNFETSTLQAVRTSTDANGSGPFTPIPTVQGFTPVSIVNGSGTAVWEIRNSNPRVIEEVQFPVAVAYNPALTPGIGTGTVTASFAPLSTAASSPATAPIPRFVDTSYRRDLFTMSSCTTTLLFPFVTNNSGFDTGLAIATTSLDSSAPLPAGVFTISNHVGDSLQPLILNLQASNQRQATANWLTVDLDQTSTPATAVWQINPAGLAPGTYQGGVTITSPRASNQLDIPFRLTVRPPGPDFTAYSLGNAGSYAPGAVAPGEAIVVFGRRFGPAALATLQLDANGRVATVIGGTRIFFDDVPAPMIYATGGQVSAFVPFSVAGKRSTRMRIEQDGVSSPEVTVPVVEAIPGLLTSNQSGTGQAAALNQNGSVNGAANPAAVGDVVVLFGTGAGQTSPGGTDGKLAGVPLPVQLLPVKAFVDGREAEVLYAGPAPSLPEGTLQVNLRIPAGITTGPGTPVWITVGTERSQFGVTVATR